MVKFYAVKVDQNSGLIVESQPGTEDYDAVSILVDDENRASRDVGYLGDYEVVMIVENQFATSFKAYFVTSGGTVREISWRVLFLNGEDRIVEMQRSNPVEHSRW